MEPFVPIQFVPVVDVVATAIMVCMLEHARWPRLRIKSVYCVVGVDTAWYGATTRITTTAHVCASVATTRIVTRAYSGVNTATTTMVAVESTTYVGVDIVACVVIRVVVFIVVFAGICWWPCLVPLAVVVAVSGYPVVMRIDSGFLDVGVRSWRPHHL